MAGRGDRFCLGKPLDENLIDLDAHASECNSEELSVAGRGGAAGLKRWQSEEYSPVFQGEQRHG